MGARWWLRSIERSSDGVYVVAYSAALPSGRSPEIGEGMTSLRHP